MGMQVDAVNRVGFRGHKRIKSHGSVALVHGQDIQGYALDKNMDGIVAASVELIVVAVMLQDEAVDVDTVAVVIFAGE